MAHEALSPTDYNYQHESIGNSYLVSPVPVQTDEIFPDDPRVLPEGSEIDGSKATKPLDEIADFVVIGSGAAGAAAAIVLARAGYSVAIVEEGRWVRTKEFGQDLHPAFVNMFREQGTSVVSGRAIFPLVQGSCVGGSTTVNSAIAWRVSEDILDDWSSRFGLGTDVCATKLDPHYDNIERDLTVRPVDDASLGEANAWFGVAAKQLGFEAHKIQRYDGGCRGSAGCLTGCRHGRKLGMNLTYIPKSLHLGARIFTHSRVSYVEIRGERAVAVHAVMKTPRGGVQLRIRAKRGVFVAASTVQTPDLLRRSGVRSKALGRHFQAHPGVSAAGFFDREVSMDFGAAQGFNSTAFVKSERFKLETITLPPELVVARLPGFGFDLLERVEKYRHMVTWAAVIRAEAEGTVGGFFGGDHVNYTLTRADMERARKALKIITEMMFSVGAREVYPGVHGMPSVLSSVDQAKLWDNAPVDPRCYTMMASHMFGAARMGPDSSRAVVNTNFGVHGTQGLYVVDSSVFPTNIGVNPQHTIMAMSQLAASNVAQHPLVAI